MQTRQLCSHETQVRRQLIKKLFIQLAIFRHQLPQISGVSSFHFLFFSNFESWL